MASHGMAPTTDRTELRPVRWALAWAACRGSRSLAQAPLPRSHSLGPLAQGVDCVIVHWVRYDLELAATRTRTDVSSRSEYGRILKADSAIPRRKGCPS